MEAAGPSMAAMQSNNQTTQPSPKKSPKKYNKFRQNKSSPRLNSPTSTNRFSRSDVRSLQNSPSTSVNSFYDHVPFPTRLPPNDVTPMNIQNGPVPQRSQESAEASQKRSQAEGRAVKTLDSLKITVHNDVQPPQRTVQANTIPFQRSMQSEPLERQQRFRLPSKYDAPSPQRAINKNALPFNPRLQGTNQEPFKPVNGDQPRPNWRQRKLYDHEEHDSSRKVIVTGFPSFTKPEELIRHLSVLGTPQIELCKNRVAVVVFKSELEAVAAVRANDSIPIYGTVLNIFKYTHRRHVMDLMKSNKRIVRHEHKGPPVAAPTEIDLSGDFHQQVQNIEDAIRLTQEEVDKINPLFKDIEKYMQMIYPNSEAIPFGSITTGLGIKSSDADCFLALSSGADGRPGRGAAEQSAAFVQRAARLLRLYPHLFHHIVSIPKANTPIVKFLHVPTNTNCDLNSKTPLGVQNSRLIGHLLKADASGRFGSVALLLKYWARVHQLSGTGRLTNYALLLMLLSYLQRSLLPPVAKLQSPAHSLIVEGWEAGFDQTPLPPVEAPPMYDLLGGFFVHYAGFNFDELVVCPLLGRPLRKADFESNALPPELALYQRNVKEGLAYPLRTDRFLCIQDPFELSHNVASAVNSRLAAEIKAFITLGAGAYTLGEKSPGSLMRSLLLSRPPPALAAVRVALPARALLALPPDWRPLARRIVLHSVFQEMLLIDLTRRDAVSREPTVEIEVYVGVVTRPVWERGAHSNARCAPADMLPRHRDVSARIAADSRLPDVRVPFEVELGFRNEPRGLTITTTAMEGAEMDAFRLFRKFAHTFIHRWFRELLKPHLTMDPSRVETVQNGDRQMTSRRQPRRPQHENRLNGRQNPRYREPPIETVAFVNSNHKDLNESLAAVSLSDSSNKESDRGDCDAN